jgi:transcription elongation factor Elf1
MCDCKAFKYAKEAYSDPGKHYSAKEKFKCLMCGANRFSRHGYDGDYDGFTFECEKCHSYIKYLKKDRKTFYKNEFYIDKYCICQHSDCIYVINEDSGKSIDLPYFEFKDKDNFISKIKKYILFS